MCGIVGYVGLQQATRVLVEGLKRLEYRGYDSAGLAVITPRSTGPAAVANPNGAFDLDLRKAVGRISVLEQEVYAERGQPLGTVGIAHTRWATHGAPTVDNAHPHVDEAGRVAVVHNGIIENHNALRCFLESTGVTFSSQTDTEVLAHLIAFHLHGGNSNGSHGHATGASSNGSNGIRALSDSSTRLHAPGNGHNGRRLTLLQAVLAALSDVTGTFGLAVVCADFPDHLVVARRGSPLLIGVGDGEYVVGSDASAIVSHTARVIYLSDDEAAEITPNGLRTVTLKDVPVTKSVEQVEVALEQIELGEHEHYMLKEICEQPESIRNCQRGRIDPSDGRIIFGGLERVTKELLRTRRFIIAGCGTAYHAGLIGEYLFEDLARINTEVEIASELRYRNPIIEEGTTALVISQSGETADTLAALREVQDKGALGLGIVNVVGSTIARVTDAGVYLHAGPEIGVASTKAFTAQVMVLHMMALWLGRRRHLAPERYMDLLRAAIKIPEQIAELVTQSAYIRDVTAKYVDQDDWLYLGRGYNYPVALEGALKLKEISYIHAEGLPAAEMKHGPIALISKGTPVVVIAPRGSHYDKMLSNIEEVKARGGRIIAVGTRGDRQLANLAEDMFEIPDVPDSMQPMLSVVPLQLLAYHAALQRNCNVDRPRNLAKSVTVE